MSNGAELSFSELSNCDIVTYIVNRVFKGAVNGY